MNIKCTIDHSMLSTIIMVATVGMLLICNGWAIAAEQPRIASCEWRIFDTGNVGGHPRLTAVRIADTQGHDGVCVMTYDGDHFSTKMQSDSKLREKATALSQSLIGQDASSPLAIKAIWEQMDTKKAGFDIETAIDLALWDLYGRANGKSVVELLGKKREKVAAYYSSWFPPDYPFNTCKNQQEAVAVYAQLARDAKKRGLRGFKIHPYVGGNWNPIAWRALKPGEATAYPEQDIEIARAVAAELGNSMPLIFDSHFSYRKLDEAIKVGMVLDELHYLWNEDPLPEWAGSTAQMREWIALKKATKTPIMGPENFLDYKTRIRWFEGGGTDWIRIDVNYGGFTPCLEMIRYSEQHKVPIDLHTNPMNAYQMACYPIADDALMPWIETMGIPQYIPVATTFPGSAPSPKDQPWFKRVPMIPVDAEGYSHFNLDIPGIGPEADWEWITAHGKDPFLVK